MLGGQEGDAANRPENLRIRQITGANGGEIGDEKEKILGDCPKIGL